MYTPESSKPTLYNPLSLSLQDTYRAGSLCDRIMKLTSLQPQCPKSGQVREWNASHEYVHTAVPPPARRV